MVNKLRKQFRSIAELKAWLDKEAQKGLIKGSSELVDVMRKHVQTDVYDTYTPAIYERSGQLKEDIQVETIENGIKIKPVRTDEATGKYIPAVIESGVGYDFSGSFEKPRPFVANTKAELQQSKQHVEVLKKALKSEGIDIR